MDLRTLVLLLGITNLLQVGALFIQYIFNRTYHGIGWWLLGYISGAFGFVLLLFRNSIPTALITIILANGLLILATIFQYIGILRFFGKREQPRLVFSILGLYLLSFLFFTYLRPDLSARSVLFSIFLILTSLLAARALLVYRTRSVIASASFNAAIFIAQGCFFIFRATDIFLTPSVNSIFTPTLYQTATFLESFIQGVLLTFGLILMVNQRLSDDSREARDHFEMIFNTGLDPTAITRRSDGVIVNINEGFTTVSGFTRDETIGKSSLENNIWQNPADRKKLIHELNEKGFCNNFEAVFVRKDGSTLTGVMSARIITLQGSPHIISIIHDITERKRLEDKLRELATIDDLTGVTNRRHFLEAAQTELIRATRYKHPLTLALIDIDHFKEINDSCGHACGDQVLLAFVKTCQQNIREIDLFARLGGDEFVLVLPETNETEAFTVVERLREFIQALPVEVGGRIITVTASAGITSLTGESESLDTLLGRADQALYRAKELGRNRVTLWDSA